MAKPEKRVRNGKVRWYARYRDPDGRQRTKVFDRAMDAQAFLDDTRAALGKGRYLDPDAGRVTLQEYGEGWLAQQTFNLSTHDAVERRLRLHVYPPLGPLLLRDIKPSTVQGWLHGIGHLSPTFGRVIYANLSTILSAAVDDELISRNPCQARSVRRPKPVARRIVPWTSAQVAAVREALPDRYRMLAVLGAGLGLRQGEVFGLSPADLDPARGVVHVQRQVKIYDGNHLTFAPPKGGKTRDVPLPDHVAAEVARHLAAYPAAQVVLPWDRPDGRPVNHRLISTSREHKALNRNHVNGYVWRPALRAAGIDPGTDTGMHALRHFYASALLEAGVSIKALSEYLGHHDPAFTLRTYTHLMPTSNDAVRHAIDALWAPPHPS